MKNGNSKNKKLYSPIPWLALHIAIFNDEYDCKAALAAARSALADHLYATSCKTEKMKTMKESLKQKLRLLCFGALMLGSVLLSGCATGPSAASVMALMQDIEHSKAVTAFGPETSWTPEQRAAYQAAVREKQVAAALEMMAEREHRQQNAAIAGAMIANGFTAAGNQIAGAQTDPFMLSKMKAQQPSALPPLRLPPIVPNAYDSNGNPVTDMYGTAY